MLTVTAERLVRRYPGIEALKELTFEVSGGTMYGLIGPDGAGKTTFMRTACCLDNPDDGTVRIGGFDVRRDASRIKAVIGYMPQRFSLYPDLTVGENLRFYADLFGVPSRERRKRIEELLAFSRLGPFVKRRAGNLSGGMKQKLALSCTLVHTPEALFLDEPTTGVDPVSRREFWEILADIKATGTTIIVSTPYMDEAERCDRIGFIHRGTMIAEGVPADFAAMFSRDLLSGRGKDIVRIIRTLTFPDWALDVRTFGDRIHVSVDNAGEAIPLLISLLKENGVGDPIVEQITPSMEDVFVEKMSDE